MKGIQKKDVHRGLLTFQKKMLFIIGGIQYKNERRKRGTREHDVLLNGLHSYPKMLGYALGFHIVKDCVAFEGRIVFSLLSIDAKEILNKANTFHVS